MTVIEKLQSHLLDLRLTMNLSIGQFARKLGTRADKIDSLEKNIIHMDKSMAMGIIGVLVAKGTDETKTMVQELFGTPKTFELLMMINGENKAS